MHEYRSYEVHRCPPSDQRKVRSVPYVHDSYVRTGWRRNEGPFDLHPFRNAANVTKSDRRPGGRNAHLGEPPRRPVDAQARARTPGEFERSVRRHLHEPAAVGPPRPKSYVSIMRQMARPLLYVPRQVKDRCNRCVNKLVVHDFHRLLERHRTELEWARGGRDHVSTGAQLVVTRKARRRRTTGLRPTA
jgi:hypothetical protein